MEDTIKIKNVNDLSEWIESHNGFDSDVENNELFIRAPRHYTMYIGFEDTDSLFEIFMKVLEYFDDFDADYEFDKMWSADFGKHNGFRPSEFLRALMSDEEDFHNLAQELREIIAKQ